MVESIVSPKKLVKIFISTLVRILGFPKLNILDSFQAVLKLFGFLIRSEIILDIQVGLEFGNFRIIIE